VNLLLVVGGGRVWVRELWRPPCWELEQVGTQHAGSPWQNEQVCVSFFGASSSRKNTIVVTFGMLVFRISAAVMSSGIDTEYICLFFAIRQMKQLIPIANQSPFATVEARLVLSRYLARS
jgi:hypothetical protein